MSDPRIDLLGQTARNRGLKLVRSKVRTPGKDRFGKVGLTDASGEPVYGMDAQGPSGALDDVEEFLRNLGARDWGASLDVAILPRKKKPKREAANDSEPRQWRDERRERSIPLQPMPEPKLKLRNAKPTDAPQIVELIKELGHDISEKQVKKNLATLAKSGETPLVATLDKRVVGVCGISRRVVIHRPAPIGRITALVVHKDAQRGGIGRKLVDAAEEWMRSKGCGLVEVTTNDRRAAAHAFYRHMGYERSSIRFFKTL